MAGIMQRMAQAKEQQVDSESEEISSIRHKIYAEKAEDASLERVSKSMAILAYSRPLIRFSLHLLALYPFLFRFCLNIFAAGEAAGGRGDARREAG